MCSPQQKDMRHFLRHPSKNSYVVSWRHTLYNVMVIYQTTSSRNPNLLQSSLWIKIKAGTPASYVNCNLKMSIDRLFGPPDLWPSLASYVLTITMHKLLMCSAVQCSAVKCRAVQCSAVQCSAVQCSAVQCSAVQYSTVQYSTVQYSTVQYSTVQ